MNVILAVRWRNFSSLSSCRKLFSSRLSAECSKHPSQDKKSVSPFRESSFTNRDSYPGPMAIVSPSGVMAASGPYPVAWIDSPVSGYVYGVS